MGSKRNLIVMGILLVGLVALYLLTSRHRTNIDTSGGFVDLVPGKLSTDEVFGIEAYRGRTRDKGLTLARQGDAWTVTSRFGAPANVNKIRSLLGNLESLEGEVRSDSPTVLADYGLSDSLALHVVLKKESGEARLHLLLGKRSGNGSFVRQDGSDKAIMASTNILGDFGIWGDETPDPDPKLWLDLDAYKVDREQVSQLALLSGGKSLELKKEVSQPPPTTAPADSNAPKTPPTYEWRVTKPTSFLALKTRGDGILGSLVAVRARDMADPNVTAEQTGLGAKADRAVLTLSTGVTDTLLFGADLPSDTTQLYFRVAGKDRVWVVPNYIKQNVFKKPEDLKPQ
jgi:hypothetical protein